MKKEMKIINRHFSFLRKALGWIQFGSQAGIALGEFSPLIDHLERYFQSRGLIDGLSYIKAVRGNYLNFLSGNPEKFPLVRLTSDGLPVCLGPLLTHLRKEEPPREILQFLNTILFSTRALKTKSLPDFNPIIAPSKRGTSYGWVSMYGMGFWQALGYRHKQIIPRALKFRRFHLTTKSGPMSPLSYGTGANALGNWANDLDSLPEKLRASIITLGGEKLKEFMDTALDLRHIIWGFLRNLVKERTSTCIRRIVWFPDKEGKTRVIAILDYFSQTVLRGLHSYLFKVLRKIPQDMTFDQGAFSERIKDWPILYSVDLSSATDRFPIDLECAILRAHLPGNYVDAWKDVMVGYPFRDSDGVFFDLNKSGEISYSVGNPMGAYSSWASFALTHHYLFYYISVVLRRDWKTLPYVLLGDDILIGDAVVAELYLKIIHDLGVDVSKAKTHISSTTCEFAKRWFHRGHEISPFPISALKESGKKYYLLTALLMDLEKKGWVWPKGIDQMVSAHLNRFNPKKANVKLAHILGEKAYVTEQMMRIIWGANPTTHMLNVARRFSIQLSTIQQTDAICFDILRNLFRYLFCESRPSPSLTRRGKGYTLGALAEHWVMYLTGLLEEEPRAMILLENPHLHVQGNIEQTYLDFIKQVRDIRTWTPTEWPFYLRNVTIPLDDSLFIDKQSQSVMMGVARGGKLFVEGLRSVAASPATIRWHDFTSFRKWDDPTWIKPTPKVVKPKCTPWYPCEACLKLPPRDRVPHS